MHEVTKSLTETKSKQTVDQLPKSFILKVVDLC